jgi:hypothetical protein
MGYRAKFSIFAAIFAVPMCLMAGWILAYVHEDIQTIKVQKAGYEILRQQTQLFLSLGKLHETLLSQSLAPDAELDRPGEEIVALQKQILVEFDQLGESRPSGVPTLSSASSVAEAIAQLQKSMDLLSYQYSLAYNAEPVVPLIVEAKRRYLPRAFGIEYVSC